MVRAFCQEVITSLIRYNSYIISIGNIFDCYKLHRVPYQDTVRVNIFFGPSSRISNAFSLWCEKLKCRQLRDHIRNAAITNVAAIVETFSTTSTEDRKPYQLRAALNRLKDRFNAFADIQDRLEELDEGEITRRFTLEEFYDTVMGKALDLLDQHEPRRSGISSRSHSPTPNAAPTIITNLPRRPRLPEIKIAEFDGSIENFPPFWDTFKTVIHDNPDLQTIQRFQYLRGLLKGSAAAAIRSLATTEENYTAAVEILKRKFDCKKKILRRHWCIMREYPPLQRDDPAALGQLADIMNQNIQKLAPETVWQWELRTQGTELPTYKQLLEFIEARATCHEVRTAPTRSYPATSSEISTSDKRKDRRVRRQASVTSSAGPTTSSAGSTTSTASATVGSSCSLHCGTVHRHISKCPIFKGLTPEQRYSKAKTAGLCINCLKPGHERSNPWTRRAALIVNASTCDLMVTARINVLNHHREPVNCRVLLDTGSTTNFMQESLAIALNLPLKPFAVPIGSLNNVNTTTRYLVTATIRSRTAEYERTLEFLTVPNITQDVPDQSLDRQAIRIPDNIKLADPEFHRPASVDMLLGSGPTLSLLCQGKKKLTPADQPELYLQQTLLGWVIGGSAPAMQPTRQRTCNILSTSNLDFDISKFWEIEDADTYSSSINKDSECERHFLQNVKRDNCGRYIVALPFNGKESLIGESRSRAFRRLKCLERRLDGDAELSTQYRAVIQEYLDLGHLTEVTGADLSNFGYYLPHHAVIKESSLTTKVRVVFDGSAKTSTGISLNETLHVGPTIQDDIFSLLLRFRLYPYVLTGDIEKMYRQVLVRPEDRQYQRILWRDSKEPVRTFELNTVTFGLSAAPYLAIRCLHQLAKDEGHRHPAAARVLQRDLYVDDLLTGTQTREEALQLRKELEGLVKLGGFNLRQWASNDPSILSEVMPDNINHHLQIGDSTTLKTLGVLWNSTADTINYTAKVSMPETATKRIILSETAKIFDPLGLLSPIVIVAKMVMQKLWTLKIDWDTPLPSDIQKEWSQFYLELEQINQVTFPRFVLQKNAKKIQLHGFSDASQHAYGACVYLRSVGDNGQVNTVLLCAKSRVAPLKQITIPRLELCGAQLLVKLIEGIKRATTINIDSTVFWTDSTIVLHWIHTPAHQLQTFVSNRVADIQSKTQAHEWRHVRTHDNPADLISRGQPLKDFIKSNIWFEGPSWLRAEETNWPVLDLQFSSPPSEIKGKYCHVAHNRREQHPLEWYSSISKLRRVIALCLRFKSKKQGPLIAVELTTAQHAIIHWLQAETLRPLKRALQDPESKRAKNPALAQVSKLTPFLDKDGLIRVGGRLRNAMIPFSQRHPIIIPKSHPVTKLIIEEAHVSQLHAGPQAVLYHIRQQYWPLDGRNSVRRIIHQCIRCTRLKPPSVNYIMGNLPSARVTESRPFTNVGIDYCGPFFVKEKKFRNRGRVKVYVAVFTCLAIKAAHLEVVSDLTTEAFLAALRRFIARRGCCRKIYSDNGTNFVGANNELRAIYEHLQSADLQNAVQSMLTNRQIHWHFIPPQSPHFGGLWEAAVKSFKHHFYRIVTDELLTFEQFNTLTIEIEAVLNSRPMMPMSSDPNDLMALTPGHFLIGESLTCPRDHDFTDTPSSRLSSWQHIQKLKQHFWTRWHREYISELSFRSKWSQGQHQIKEGTVVLLKEDNLPALQWALGRVIKVRPGADGIIRVVTVKTAKGLFDRNVKRLAPLPINEDDTEVI
ncbi:uncharacterized protein LOC135169789 [Diachasmimorpha longicaudata]|uniref:uncharacterized protein LOC135169789 n=1 Tax=Diachasmimorpha longicaudata TaxID=58733 RepID=UPI0030B8F90E